MKYKYITTTYKIRMANYTITPSPPGDGWRLVSTCSDNKVIYYTWEYTDKFNIIS